MSNQQLATRPASALAIMADRCNVDPTKLHLTLKNTVFKGATDDELLSLVVTANRYGLDPFLKQIYAFPKKGGGIVPLVGFDGWIAIANRAPNYDGMTVEVYGQDKNPTHATCEIYLKDRSKPVTVTEYFGECYRNTDPWNTMPRRMMRNKVIIQAIRVAFGVGGIYDEEEAAEIAMRPASGRVVDDAPTERKAINPFKDEPKDEPRQPDEEDTGADLM